MDLGVIGLNFPTHFVFKFLLYFFVGLHLLHYFDFVVLRLDLFYFPFFEVRFDDLEPFLHFLLLSHVQVIDHSYVLPLGLLLLVVQQVLHPEVLWSFSFHVFVDLLALNVAIRKLAYKILPEYAAFSPHCALLPQGSLFANFHFIFDCFQKL